MEEKTLTVAQANALESLLINEIQSTPGYAAEYLKELQAIHEFIRNCRLHGNYLVLSETETAPKPEEKDYSNVTSFRYY